MQKLKRWFDSVPWKHGFTQMFIAVDQLLNVFLGNPFSRDTWADETISSRCGRKLKQAPYKWYAIVIDALFFWQGPNHCRNAYEKEKTRYHFHPEMRD